MQKNKNNVFYTKNHEWVKIDNNIALCGLSNYFKESLGELVYVELPKLNKKVNAGDDICLVESVKTIYDIYAPLSGIVVAINKLLLIKKPLIYSYDKDWLFKIKMNNVTEIKTLLSIKKYNRLYFGRN